MKPPRTLGLSLAIVTSVVLFSVLPLLQVSAPWLIQYRMRQTSVALPDDSTSPIAVGGEFVGISDGEIFFQVGSSVVFLLIAVGAWLGRPRWIRTAMIAAVLGLLLVTVVTSIAALITPQRLDAGIDSGYELARALVYWRLLISGGVALYVLWYMNRGPARAFYRGYYLERGEQVHRSQ